MSYPLVTVICVCYNQARFVGECLLSVRDQTYPAVELIVVDDASTDGSAAKIESYLEWVPGAVFVRLPENRGVCAAFNQGLRHATGEFIIDLSADDVLLPGRIERQVRAFADLPPRYGVVFSNAEIINERSESIGYWHDTDASGHAVHPVPSGDVYKALLRQSFLCTPTMMSRKSLYDALGGYDEALSYEDFDFWVRTAKHHAYHYLDEVTTRRRRVAGSSSEQFYVRGAANRHLSSTLAVCRKAHRQNTFDTENQALAVGLRYYLRLALFTENLVLAQEFAQLLDTISPLTFLDRFWLRMARIPVPLFPFYRRYLRLRHPTALLG